MLSNEDITYRLYKDEDKGFVFSSYLKSFRDEVKMGTSNYYKQQHSKFEELMDKATCLIAVHPVNQNDIFGWALVSKGDKEAIIHYVYVKRIYRNFGIGTGLLSQFGLHWKENIVFTDHMTKASRFLQKIYNTIEVIDDKV